MGGVQGSGSRSRAWIARVEGERQHGSRIFGARSFAGGHGREDGHDAEQAMETQSLGPARALFTQPCLRADRRRFAGNWQATRTTSCMLWMSAPPAVSASARRGAQAALLGVAIFAATPARAAPLDAVAVERWFDPADGSPADGWLGPIGPTALYTPAELPTEGRAGHGLWLAVSGGVTRSPGERQRIFGLLELGVGLDDWVGERAPDRRSDDSDAPGDGRSEAGARGELEGLGDERRMPVAGAGGALAENPRAPLRRSLSDDALPERVASAGAPLEPRLTPLAPSAAPAPAGLPPRPRCSDPRSCDPAVLAALARAAVDAALRVQGGGVELRRLDGMAARSRAAASLPEVRLGAGTSRDESLRLAPTAADPARFTRDGGRDLWFEARLTWRLDSAIFARDELAVMRLRAQQREETARLTADVLEALVSWQRARLVLVSDKAPPDERDAAAVRQFGAVARLDVLTDGWFSRELARAGQIGARAVWP
jgi:hypothetical protein